MFPLASVSDSVGRGWDEFFQWVPKFLGLRSLTLLRALSAGVDSTFIKALVSDVQIGSQAAVTTVRLFQNI